MPLDDEKIAENADVRMLRDYHVRRLLSVCRRRQRAYPETRAWLTKILAPLWNLDEPDAELAAEIAAASPAGPEVTAKTFQALWDALQEDHQRAVAGPCPPADPRERELAVWITGPTTTWSDLASFRAACAQLAGPEPVVCPELPADGSEAPAEPAAEPNYVDTTEVAP